MVPGYMDDVFRMTGDHQIFVCRDHPHRHGAALALIFGPPVRFAASSSCTPNYLRILTDPALELKRYARLSRP
jgi:hypothetical protein